MGSNIYNAHYKYDACFPSLWGTYDILNSLYRDLKRDYDQKKFKARNKSMREI